MSMLMPIDRVAAKKELARPGSDEYLKMQIKAQLARFLFRDNGYYAITLQDDPVVNKALEVMNSSEYSKIVRGK